MIVCLALSPSVDITYGVPGFAVGEVNRPETVLRVPGGKGLNVARAAHRLGASVAAIAPLGGTAGMWMREALTEEGVAVTVVEVDAPTRLCHSIVDTASSSPVSTDLYEPAHPLSDAEFAEIAEAALALPPGGWVTISGSVPAPLNALVTLIATLRSRGWRFALDSHGEALAALLPLADLVKVNVEEAHGVLGGTGDAAECAVALAGGRDAVVTDGVRGAVAVSASGDRRSLVSSRRGIYPVGSGDSFFAGLLTGLDEGSTVTDALPLAVAAGVANALHPGPAIFDATVIPTLLAELAPSTWD